MTFFRRFLVAAALACSALTVLAVPNVDQVQAQIASGNFVQAESMMREVVAAKPNSARAHYVYAEILAHNRRFDQAIDEARTAQRLDPKLGFTQPEKFRSFEQLLEREQAAAQRALPSARAAAPMVSGEMPRSTNTSNSSSSSGVPGWVWGLGLAVLGLLAWRMMRRTSPPQPAYATGGMSPAFGGGNAGGYGPGTGFGPGYAGPSAGSGLLGTGLAVAGGVAAGMLAEKLLDGRHDSNPAANSNASPDGLVPGMFDNPSADNGAARELEDRPIDFGSGDGWSDGGGGDGGVDVGGDGGGGGDW